MTIIADTPVEIEALMPANKQVQISVGYIQSYIDLITSRVRFNSQTLHKQAAELEPPYPFFGISEAHHQPELETVCHSALLALAAEMKSIPESEWKTCVEEYLKIPSRRAQGNYDGMASPSFNDTMLELANKIGIYMEANGIKVPYMRDRASGTISYRVIAHIALIWLGRKYTAEEAEKSHTAKQ